MADINQLSNEEIRVQLQRFGYQVGPVTQYSRNVYIKRLRQLIVENADKYQKSDVRARLSTLSSEDDTDEAETAPSNRSGRKKRRSSHNPSSNIPYRNSRSAPNVKDPCIVNAFRVPVIRSARKSVLVRGTGEVKEREPIRGLYTEYPYSLETLESDEADVQSGAHSRQKYVFPDGKSYFHSSTAESHGMVSPPGTSTSRLLSAIRTVINPFGSLTTAFARRSRVSDSCIENNGFIPQPRFGNLERQSNRTLENFLTTEERNWFSRNCQVVPKTLVLIVMLFFLGLAVSYAALGRVKSFRNQTGNHYPICPNKPANSVENCVPTGKLQTATNLMKIATPLIEKKSEEYACQSLYGKVVPEQILLTKSNLLAYLRERYHSYNERDIENVEILISSNPHWGYTISRKSGEVMYVYTSRAPITCYVMYHLNWFVNRLVEAALCVVIIFVVFKLLSAYKAHAEAHKRNVRGMVARITKFLRAEFENNVEEPFFVVIDYVRDQLIPAQDYKRMALVWTSAVNFIRQNDPRIKEEQCVVNGELKTVWRWLPDSGNASSEQSFEFNNSSQGSRSILSDVSGSSGGDTINQQQLSRSHIQRSSKIWQGQAFETMAGSPNSVPCSPTPCLKIRHMFDPDAEHGEDWPTFIRDAILEKCEGVAILHLFVDKTSREGCVYVKCRTPEDAGRAYCALHGWWFGNSHLVTVKYLRIERYHERFPGAVNATSVLKPTNNQRLSMGD